MKSVMQHQFSQVPDVKTQRSSFDRSHGYKTTFDAGKLIPIFVDEALPGDTFNLNMTGFARMATPIHPLFDNMYMDTHFFSVPYRLVWDNWKKFNGEQDNPGDSTDYLVPSRTAAISITSGSIGDYFGLPTGAAIDGFSVLPFRAMVMIWNEWFRDQNLQDSYEVIKDDSQQIATSIIPTSLPLPRGKRHDYFTSCLSSPQKGPSVTLPLGSTAPVEGSGSLIYVNDGISVSSFMNGTNAGKNIETGTNHGSQALYFDKLTPDGSTGLQADLSTATAATINEIRQAFQVQKLFERDARGGTRYNELIKSHFGVTVPDFRVQRPEYLGGGSSMVNITPIAQTSETNPANTEQGNLAGMGTATLNNHGFKKSFTEHCIVIGFVSVRADLTYQQGLDRMWSRQTRFDFYQPTLAHLGEQAVLSKEIYADGSANDEDVFGYQERYAEYRYKPSKITGQFRSGHATPLDTWHLSQEFSTRPQLNSTFIEENPPLDRVIAVPSEPHFLFDSYFKFRCSRPMPLYSVPGFVDHF